jgi:ferrous iron transport protein A
MEKTNSPGTRDTGTINGRTLAELRPGEHARVCSVQGSAVLKRRLLAMGIVNGVEIKLEHTALLGDPRVYNILGYDLSLRNEDARRIVVES